MGNTNKLINDNIKKKLNKICMMNYEKENEKINNIFEKILMKIFNYNHEDIEEMNADDLLSIMRKLSKKYKIHLSYIFLNINSCEGMSASLIDRNIPTYEMICTIYAKTLNELFKKASICIYFYIKDKKQEEIK